MIAAAALLALLAVAGEPQPLPIVWLVADSAAATNAERMTGELRVLDCAVVAAQVGPGETPTEVAHRLLGGTPGIRRAVVLLHAPPASVEVWWADERDQSDHETLPPGAPAEWTRLDAIRVAETVRARVSPPIATPPGAAAEGPPVVAAAAVAPAAIIDPFLRVAAGAGVSGLGAVGTSAGATIASGVRIWPRTRIVGALTIPTDNIVWWSNNGQVSAWDTAVAVSLERAFTLLSDGPGHLELRAGVGLAVHRRRMSGTSYLPLPAGADVDAVSYFAGPVLGGTLALVRNRFAMLATASGGATFPDSDFYAGPYSLSSPGRFNWSIGLMAEVAIWMQQPR